MKMAAQPHFEILTASEVVAPLTCASMYKPVTYTAGRCELRAFDLTRHRKPFNRRNSVKQYKTKRRTALPITGDFERF